MTKAKVKTTISKEQLHSVRDLKHFHDYTVNQMASMFNKAIKEKMNVSSRDLVNEAYLGGGALEVTADVVIMSTEEYNDLLGVSSGRHAPIDTGGTMPSFADMERVERERREWGIFG